MDIISSLNSWLESQLSSNQYGFSAFLFLFLGGGLASLLPCTYPIYPITAQVIRSRSKNSNKWTHPIVYYFGLAFMYLLFGLIAGLFGGSFNLVLRKPEINLFIGFIMLLLGLTSIELLYLPIFSPKSLGENQSGYFGTFLSGMAAGLLSSPCVGPIVVMILLNLTVNSTRNLYFSMTISSLKMFTFGLGVGLPFLLIGVLGLMLPRSGSWMRSIQYVLSILIFYFSFTFYEKGMTLLGFAQKDYIYILFGLFISFIGFYFYSDDEKLPPQKVQSALSGVGILLGLLVVFFTLYQKPIQPSIPIATQINIKKEDIFVNGNLKWYRNKMDAMEIAQKEDKKIFIDFYADWCTNCKEFEKLTLSKPELNAALSKVVLYKVYDTDKEFDNFAKDQRFLELNVGLPFFVILSPNGELVFKTTDYLKTKEMIEFMK